MLNEDYDISIIGKQSLDGESDEVCLNTVGSYTCEGDTKYITYNEYDSDAPSSVHTSTLKVEEGCMTMMSGNSDTHLILEKGKRHRCYYDTGVGTLALGIFTSTFNSNLEAHGGKLNVKYTLDVDFTLSSCNEITVNVRKRNSTEDALGGDSPASTQGESGGFPQSGGLNPPLLSTLQRLDKLSMEKIKRRCRHVVYPRKIKRTVKVYIDHCDRICDSRR